MDFETEKQKITKLSGKQLVSANILGIHAGTTGPQGGDWGHGSRAYVKLKDEGGTGWLIRVDGEVFQPTEIEILVGGDSELETFKNALFFAAKNV